MTAAVKVEELRKKRKRGKLEKELTTHLSVTMASWISLVGRRRLQITMLSSPLKNSMGGKVRRPSLILKTHAPCLGVAAHLSLRRRLCL